MGPISAVLLVVVVGAVDSIVVVLFMEYVITGTFTEQAMAGEMKQILRVQTRLFASIPCRQDYCFNTVNNNNTYI